MSGNNSHWRALRVHRRLALGRKGDERGHCANNIVNRERAAEDASPATGRNGRYSGGEQQHRHIPTLTEVEERLAYISLTSSSIALGGGDRSDVNDNRSHGATARHGRHMR